MYEIDEPAVTPVAIIDQDEHLITVVTPVDPNSDEEEVMYTHFCTFYHKSAYYALHARICTHVHIHTFSLLTTRTYTCIMSCTLLKMMDVAIDSRGIPGWERVDRLARALLDLKGLCITNAQAEIKTLYSQRLEHDKKPITFQPRQVKQPKGKIWSIKVQNGSR